MKTAVIRIIKTGELVTVRSYWFAWVDAKGNKYHRTEAKLVKLNG